MGVVPRMGGVRWVVDLASGDGWVPSLGSGFSYGEAWIAHGVKAASPFTVGGDGGGSSSAG